MRWAQAAAARVDAAGMTRDTCLLGDVTKIRWRGLLPMLLLTVAVRGQHGRVGGHQLGEIVIELDAAKAPKAWPTSSVRQGRPDRRIFHRVIPNFMIQGGGFDPDMKQKPTRAPIPLESKNGLNNVRGSVAMARTNVPDSATAQFFINLKDNAFLDSANTPDGTGYAVFGKVVSGMDVVDKIWAVPTGNRGPYQNVPVTPVLIRKASVES